MNMTPFDPGKLTFVLDASFGSSGKGKLSAFLTEVYRPDFLVTSNSANASHTVSDGSKTIVFKALPSGSFYHERVKAVYLTAGSSFKIADLLSEIEQTGIPRNKVKIHPLASVITDADAAFERGEIDLDGNPSEHVGTIATGSTCSGSGASLARKVLRRKPTFASGFPEIEDLIAVSEKEISNRLSWGETGLFEIGQGFPLSMNHWRFAPHTTSRNVTVSAALNDAMLPPAVAGPVILNFRTYPIRINSKKFIGEDGQHLAYEQVLAGVPHKVVDSYSGSWYPDQEEITWEDVETWRGAPIASSIKNTTLTKLPRRIATFSDINLLEAVAYNRTSATFFSVNFINHLDAELEGTSGVVNGEVFPDSPKVQEWLSKHFNKASGGMEAIAFYGTGMNVNDMIVNSRAVPIK